MAIDGTEDSIWTKRKEELLGKIPILDSKGFQSTAKALKKYVEILSAFFEQLENERKSKIDQRGLLDQKLVDAENALEEAIAFSQQNDSDIEAFKHVTEWSETIVDLKHDIENLELNDDRIQTKILKLPEKEYSIRAHSELGHQPVYLLNTLYEQASLDISRMPNRVENKQEKRPDSQLLSEFIGHWALTPQLIKENFRNSVGERRVNSYLTDRFEIRILPYSNNLLIGIASSAYAKIQGLDYIASTDFMAIPHEIGHHVFRHVRAETTGSSLRDHLTEQILQTDPSIPAWALGWLEEMFADVYGCFFAGALSIAGFQNMLVSSPPSRVFMGSKTHPLAALRPIIQTRMLAHLWKEDKKTFEERIRGEIEILDKAWRGEAQDLWGIQRLEDHLFPVNGVPMQGTRILTVVEPMLHKICTELNIMFGVPRPFGQEILATYTIGKTELLIVNGPAEVVAAAAQQQSIMQDEDVTLINTDFERLKIELDRLSKHRTQVIGIDELADAILFSGWSDEGPKAGHGTGGG